MRLILGCGEKRYEAGLHVDIRLTSATDLLLDLNKIPWPLETEAFEEVIAEDIIEHLSDVIKTVEECYRVLKPGGSLRIITPHYMHENSWIDPTHKWHLTEKSFDYFDPSTNFGKKYSFYTTCKFKITHKDISNGNICVIMEKI